MQPNRLLLEVYNSGGSSHNLNYGIYRETSPQALSYVLKSSSVVARGRTEYIDISTQYLEKGQYYIALQGDSTDLALRMATINLTTKYTPWWYYDAASFTLDDSYSLTPNYLTAAPWCGLIDRY